MFNAVKKHKETDEFVDEKRSERLRKLGECDQRHLKRLVKGKHRLSVSKIMKDLNQSLPEPITSCTVFNYVYLKRLDYEYKVKLKKQWLDREHREQRVAWCRRHAHFSQNDWRSVIFSDEPMFYVLERKNQVKILHTDEERVHQDCIQLVSTGKRGKLDIWGGILGLEPTEARIFDENMDG